jgi:tetratricopeptide (TPR) repeat protein
MNDATSWWVLLLRKLGLIRLDPKTAAAYCNRGYSYLETGEYDKAIAVYTDAILLDPKQAVASAIVAFAI